MDAFNLTAFRTNYIFVGMRLSAITDNIDLVSDAPDAVN